MRIDLARRCVPLGGVEQAKAITRASALVSYWGGRVLSHWRLNQTPAFLPHCLPYLGFGIPIT